MKQSSLRDTVASTLADTQGLDATSVPNIIGGREGTLADRLRASRWLIFDADTDTFAKVMSALAPLMSQDEDARAAFDNLMTMRAGMLRNSPRRRGVALRKYDAVAGKTLASSLLREAMDKTFAELGFEPQEVAYITLGEEDTCGQCEMGGHAHDSDGRCHNVHPVTGQHCACTWRPASTTALLN